MRDTIEFNVEDMNVWGARIREVREALGYSVESMAQMMDVEPFLLDMTERGKGYMLSLVQKVLDPKWGVNRDWFFDGKLPMFTVKETPDERDERYRNMPAVKKAVHDEFDNMAHPCQNTEEDVSFMACVHAVFGEDSHIGREIIQRCFLAEGAQQLLYFEHGMRYAAQLIVGMLCNRAKSVPKDSETDIRSLMRDCLITEQAG